MKLYQMDDALLEYLLILQNEEDGFVLAETTSFEEDDEIISNIDATVIITKKDEEEVRIKALEQLPESIRLSRRKEAKKLDSDTLRRFVLSYGYDQKILVHKVREHVAWRVRNTEVLLPMSAPLVADSGVLQVCGRSTHGDAVLLFDAVRWYPWLYGESSAQCINQFAKYTTFFFEVASRLADHPPLGSQGFIILVSMADRPTLLRPIALRCIYAIVRLTLDHYPNRLQAVYLLGAPPLFSAAWKIIRPWLDEQTIQRTFFLKTPQEIYSTLHDKVASDIALHIQELRQGTSETKGMSSTGGRDSLLKSKIHVENLDVNTQASSVLASCNGSEFFA